MNLLARDLWQEVRDEFRTERGSAVAEMWLQQTRPLAFARGVFTLGVPNEVVRDWLEHRYRGSLETIFQERTGSPVRVLLRVEPTLPTLPSELPLSVEAGELEPAPTLLVRSENRLAHGAIQRVLSDPAAGNPLFIYGAAGTGKTRLVQHHLHRLRADEGDERSVLVVEAEAFSQGLVRAIRDGDVPAFRGRMLAADVFVMEEAHRLRGKPRTQREFLSILRYHLDRGRPVILTSRHPPNAVFQLNEAVRSYFLSGLLLRIPEYGHPSRVAILEAQAERFARPVPNETIERIATRIPGSFDRHVRYLEKIAAFAGLAGTPATPEFLAEKFPEMAGTGERDVDLNRLIEQVAQEFDTTPDDIASNRKVRSAVLGRHLVVYLATVVFNLKSRRVMRHLGGLSPSMTAYARRNIEAKRRDDPIFDARVRRLLDELNRGQRLLF